MMTSLWLSAVQHEHGSPFDIRHPPTPGLSFETTDSRGYGTDEPNQSWSHSSEPSCPAREANGPHSPFIGQESIEWEEVFNVQVFRRMQAIHQRLAQRLGAHDFKRKRIRIGNVSFFRDLEEATRHWLREVEEEAKASEEELDAYRLQHIGQFIRDSAPSSAPDGNMVCAILVRNIRRYETRWKDAFDAGKDPDRIPVPCLTKDTLVSIIRQCPVVQRGHQDKYSYDWLLENVGDRFFTQGHRDERTGRLHLAHVAITQTDLGCTDEVWSALKPGKVT